MRSLAVQIVQIQAIQTIQKAMAEARDDPESLSDAEAELLPTKVSPQDI